jgi:NAD(P)-dependent dehydrogenase (short-subunit alcohol dehydrogenase family)
MSKAALLRFSDCLAEEVKEHNIAIFALHPGNIRTDMMNYLLESEEGQTWMPWVRPFLEDGNESLPEAPAKLVAFLASGHADVLSGRFFQVSEDVADMVRRAEEIQRDDLHALRLRV